MNLFKKVLEVRFYTAISGKEPVRIWLKEQDPKDRKIIGGDILTVESEWPVGMPLVRPFGKGLWEVRSTLDNRIARVIFIIKDSKMVLLHAFIKKTQKTDPSDIKISQKRAKEYLLKGITG